MSLFVQPYYYLAWMLFSLAFSRFAKCFCKEFVIIVYLYYVRDVQGDTDYIDI